LKILLLSAALAVVTFCNNTLAATYSFVNDTAVDWSLLHGRGTRLATWDALLTANSTGDSFLSGTATAVGGSQPGIYSINVTLTDTYFLSGSDTQYWGSFSGSFARGNDPIVTFIDRNSARTNDLVGGVAPDARLGLNVATRNDPVGSNPLSLEFFLIGGSSRLGSINFEINELSLCTSNVPNVDGTCSAIAVSPVPEPSEMVLMLSGLGIVAVLARRRKSQGTSAAG
jgi:PEP-CTERM motif